MNLFVVYDYLPESVIICQEKTIIYMNEMAERLLGESKNSVIGKSILDYVHPIDHEGIILRMESLMNAQGISEAIELQLRNTDGEYMDVEATSNFVTFEGEPAAITILRNIVDRKRKQLEILHMAYHDELTGLPNRRKIAERIEGMIQHYGETNRPFAVIAMDLDRFKEINDTLGHKYGDYVLTELGARLQIVNIDYPITIARMGGDEFMIILHEYMDRSALVQLVEKLLDIIRRPYFLDGRLYELSASIGIAMYPEDGRSVEDLLSEADKAMYAQKKNGRNGYRFSSQTLFHV